MKKKIVLIIGLALFLTISITALAAFVFYRVVDGEASSGTVNVSEMYFGDYSQVTQENKEASYSDAKGKSITCYATEKKGYADETNDIYLNQLSLKFSYELNMAVYVRIHIQDAWISTKTYTNGNINRSYIEKDKLAEGVSPFQPSDSNIWIYDEATNCIYLKEMVTLNEGVESQTMEHEFQIDSEYFYNSPSSTSYREAVTVQISYFVDIVQANRAEKKWQVSFTELGIE